MIDILQIMEAEGLQFRRAGREYVCLCVFHPDKHPSMYVNQEKGLYHCKACGAGGDALTFIMEYKSLTFPQAKKYLGLDEGKDELEIEIEKERAKTRKAFRDWCLAEELRLMNLTMDLYELLNKAETKYIFGIDSIADDVRNLSKYNHHLDILMGQNERLKLELYRNR